MARFSKKINRRRTKRQQRKSRQGKRRSSKFLLRSIFKGGELTETGIPPKNILLIIDPQNDFSDAKSHIREAAGSLAVSGASADYEKIIEFINKNNNKIHEIHVSLDTHTDRHIGHPKFWQVKIDETKDDTDDTNWIDATDEHGLSMLSIDNNNKITGLDIKTTPPTKRTFCPKKYDADSYPALCTYVNNYLHFFDRTVDDNGNIIEFTNPENKHKQVAWIWITHCIEGTPGHNVAQELEFKLNEFAKTKVTNDGRFNSKVFYHIKGQNNLAEMYSIFSAEKPVSIETINPYLYTGSYLGKKYINTGAPTYEQAATSYNPDTTRNTTLMDQLLGTNNKIYVCGQAKTHCVKSSIIDLMEYAKDKNITDTNRIVLLADMSSPIIGVPNDIEEIVEKNGFTVLKDVPEI